MLQQLGLTPDVRPADIDEAYVVGEAASARVERLARAKAEVVAARDIHALVVAGDTEVVCDRRVLGKPKSADDAVTMLLGLSGRSHEVYTGLALAGGHGTVSALARAVVRLRAFDRITAQNYVATGEPMDKAGAYGIQGLGAALVDSVDGDYYCVVGFPVGAFIALLARAGWRYEFGRLTPMQR